MTSTPTDSTPDEPDDQLEEAPAAGGDEVSNALDTSDGGTDDHPAPRSREETYRKRARAAEVELTLARARVSEMNRAEAERLAVQRMADAEDLWVSGVTVDDVLGDDGLIDTAKIDTAVTDLLARKPHLARRGPVTPPASNITGEGKRPGGDEPPTWEDAFSPGRG